MGRHFEVRAAAMAKSGARKSALYARASREIYMAAKSGIPDSSSNLALRSAIDKFKGQSIPRDVIDRAIKKAQGGDAETYTAGRYEAFGPGNSYLLIDSLTDNANRAFVEIRTLVVKKGGHMGTVSYNFTETGILVFAYPNKNEVEETLILGDVDLREISSQDGVVEVLVEPSSFAKAKELLRDLKVEEYQVAEIQMLANETIVLEGEEKNRFQELIDALDEVQDVQNVFHNVDL
ncbi:MAG: YebC/PmpR family DNA-binding transcriptional regulator [Bacteroidia bacterium]|nr:YebC/PmpR family DNA-binding transcriptional regulator [Bacteroidia bacterium]